MTHGCRMANSACSEMHPQYIRAPSLSTQADKFPPAAMCTMALNLLGRVTAVHSDGVAICTTNERDFTTNEWVHKPRPQVAQTNYHQRRKNNFHSLDWLQRPQYCARGPRPHEGPNGKSETLRDVPIRGNISVFVSSRPHLLIQEVGHLRGHVQLLFTCWMSALTLSV